LKEVIININNLSVYFDYIQAVNNVSTQIYSNKVTSIIGPSGCGKTSFLRTLNRMNELMPGFRMTGEVLLNGQNIYSPEIDEIQLRKYVGMVFQRANLFPKSIFENVTFALRIRGVKDQKALEENLEKVCVQADIWNEIKDRLQHNALDLSAGQQQRLCIARALAGDPAILLMDEPATALDPSSTQKIEELIRNLSSELTIVLVTHNLQQAARISDYTSFFYLGQLVESGKTTKIFTNPANKQTEDYISGRFG